MLITLQIKTGVALQNPLHFFKFSSNRNFAVVFQFFCEFGKKHVSVRAMYIRCKKENLYLYSFDVLPSVGTSCGEFGLELGTYSYPEIFEHGLEHCSSTQAKFCGLMHALFSEISL